MKKKMISTLLCVSMIATMVAGCGSSSKEVATETTATETEATETESTNAAESTEGTTALTTDEITLKVWESSGQTEEFIKQAGAAFTAKYPNITIEFENVEVGDAKTQIALDGPAGVGADVFAAPHDTIGGLVAGGHILPTENIDEVKANTLASCIDAITYEGAMYGYPVAAETYALFYNKDLVTEDQVPKSWEEVEEFCKGFNAANKYGLIWNVSDSYYAPMFTGMGGNRLFGETGTDVSTTYLNSDNAVKGMTYFQSLRSILDVPSADIADSSVCLGAFTSGNAAMYVTGPWNVATCEEAGMNFGVTTLPSLPGETTPAQSFSGARTMQVSAYSNYPAEAQAFAQFCASEEMQKLRFEITGALPSIDIEVESEYAQGFLDQLQYACPTPSVPEMTGYWEAMKSACANIWDGADVKTELDSCDQAILAQ